MLQCDAIRMKSFCGDVVLNSFYLVYSDEDRIYDQKFDKRISWDLYHKDFKVIAENAYLKKYGT